jgi:hypothetical protein
MNEELKVACDCCPNWKEFLFLASYFVGSLLVVAALGLIGAFVKKVSDWLQIGKRWTELKEENALLRKQCDDLSVAKRHLTLKVEELGHKIKRLGES